MNNDVIPDLERHGLVDDKRQREGIFMERHGSHEDRRNRTNFNNPLRRTRSISGTRTSTHRVTIDSTIQTQEEVNSSTEKIRAIPGGIPLMGFLRYRSTLPGPPDDFKAIAHHINIEEERQRKLRQTSGMEQTRYTKTPTASRMEDEQHYLHIQQPHAPITLPTTTNDRRIRTTACVEPPRHFIPGTSSVTDAEGTRMFKISRYFPPLMGTKKFTGKRSAQNDEGTITSLLQSMNSAHNICPVTESEFLYYLIQSVSGDAHVLITELVTQHQRGQLTIQDIYEILTEHYFHDIRPNTADKQLRDMTENNHGYYSLQDAITNITKLSRASAQDSDDSRNRKAFANRDFVRTMINILPKEYKPFIMGKIAEERKKIQGDMTAKDLTNILDIYRVPLDEWFRKVYNRQQTPSARIRLVENHGYEEEDHTRHQSEDEHR